jgi:hypothetical protein
MASLAWLLSACLSAAAALDLRVDKKEPGLDEEAWVVREDGGGVPKRV